MRIPRLQSAAECQCAATKIARTVAARRAYRSGTPGYTRAGAATNIVAIHIQIVMPIAVPDAILYHACDHVDVPTWGRGRAHARPHCLHTAQRGVVKVWSRPPRPPGPRSTITSKPVADAVWREPRRECARRIARRSLPGRRGAPPGRTRGLTHATIAFAYALWSACRFGSFATLGTVSSTVRLPGLVIVKTIRPLCDSV